MDLHDTPHAARWARRFGRGDREPPQIDRDQFVAQWARRFGSANPERMDVPFWLEQVRTRAWPSVARKAFDMLDVAPVWNFARYGTSDTLLPDGRVVCVAGEHEDWYDDDFCIYNDVVVLRPDGGIEIYGHPSDVFPPTDFHSATLVGDAIYLIGSLGYKDARRPGETPIYRLDVRTFEIERVMTTGEQPGWVFKHSAMLDPARKAIHLWGGQLAASVSPSGQVPNELVHRLDLSTLTWSCVGKSDEVGPLDAAGSEER